MEQPDPTFSVVSTPTDGILTTLIADASQTLITDVITVPTTHITVFVTTTMSSPYTPTKSLNDRDLLIGVALGAGPFFIAIVIFLFGRHIKRVSKRKRLLASEEQYNTTHLPKDPSVETASLFDDDAPTVHPKLAPLGYSDPDKHDQTRTSLPISGRVNPYTRLNLTNSPETPPSSPPQSYPVSSQFRIPTLPTTVFNEEAETPRRPFQTVHDSLTLNDAASSRSRQRTVRPLPNLPIPRQETNLDSARTLVNEMASPPPPVSSGMARVRSEKHTDSGVRLGKQTLAYELSLDTNSEMTSEPSMKSKKRPPPIYTHN